MEALILAVLPYVVTFLIGFVIKSPIYQKGKHIITEFVKGIEDDKFDSEEVKRVYEAIKAKK